MKVHAVLSCSFAQTIKPRSQLANEWKLLSIRYYLLPNRIIYLKG